MFKKIEKSTGLSFFIWLLPAIILFLLPCVKVSAFVDQDAPCDKAAWMAAPHDIMLVCGSRDTLLRRHDAPLGHLDRNAVLKAWRGERVGAEFVLYTRKAISEPVMLRVQNQDAHLEFIPGFMRYVWTDDFRGCGDHPTHLQPWGVPDCIDLPGAWLKTSDMECRPIWLSVEVGASAKSGKHDFRLQVVGVKSKHVYASLDGSLDVDARQLPAPKDYKFHLDFWQQPYSVARYYQVEPWSDAHLALLKPYMKRLARAGQKVVSTVLFYEPWGRQSNDKFQPMVETILQRDGKYRYDYTVFDKWVNFMAECGIDEQIDCYSMVPWDMSFRYYDEASSSYKTLSTKTDSKEYKDLWINFLQSFAKHLREKGWFEKTCIAMDERGMQDMMNAYKVAQEAVPGIKMTLAGNMHRELVPILEDYCLAIGPAQIAWHTRHGKWPQYLDAWVKDWKQYDPSSYFFTSEDIQQRRAAGRHSTIYTCCTEAHPNILSNSVPQEAAYLPIVSTMLGVDGYLHWAWLNWTDDPLHDTRFKYFSPGDTYVIYPGNRSSVRWERFVEGVQQSEKLQMLSTSERAALEEAVINIDVRDAQAVKQAVDYIEKIVN